MKRLRLVLALIVAALFSDIFDRATWRKARAAFKAMFGLMENSEKADPEVYAARMAACGRCPFYFTKWGMNTCGSALSKELRGYGCGCFMPSKAEDVQATCWADDECHDFKFGWKAAGL